MEDSRRPKQAPEEKSSQGWRWKDTVWIDIKQVGTTWEDVSLNSQGTGETSMEGIEWTVEVSVRTAVKRKVLCAASLLGDSGSCSDLENPWMIMWYSCLMVIREMTGDWQVLCYLFISDIIYLNCIYILKLESRVVRICLRVWPPLWPQPLSDYDLIWLLLWLLENAIFWI